MRIFEGISMRIIMATRLNITLNKTVIENAKQYAKSQGRSLSGLIEEYLKSLTSGENSEPEIDPLVKSMWGSVQSISPSKDYDELIEEEIIKKHLK